MAGGAFCRYGTLRRLFVVNSRLGAPALVQPRSPAPAETTQAARPSVEPEAGAVTTRCLGRQHLPREIGNQEAGQEREMDDRH